MVSMRMRHHDARHGRRADGMLQRELAGKAGVGRQDVVEVDRADGVDAEFLRSAMVDIVDSREDISWFFADNVPLLLLSPPFHAALAARQAIALDCGFERGHRIARGKGMEGVGHSGGP